MKRLAILAFVVVGLVVGMTTAEAANGGTTKSTFPATFVMSSATCKNLPAGSTVTGSGIETSITTVTTDDNVTTIVNETRAHGRATDQAGNVYRFIYVNHFRLSNTVSHPAVYSGLMTDLFALDGKGPLELHNGFVADLTTKPDFSYVYNWNFRQIHGDPIAFVKHAFVAHCDPL